MAAFADTGLPSAIMPSALSPRTNLGRRTVAPAPGIRPKIDFGQAQLRVAYGDAVRAGHGDFESAAESGAVDCSNPRLCRSLDGGDHVGEMRLAGRPAEFAHVGAGDKGASCAFHTTVHTVGSVSV
ncbi:MAG: hypothetical protein P8Z80_05280 [Pseudolabrys sp.]